MRIWAVALASVALASGTAELGWLVMVGTAVAGSVVGALAGSVWAEETGRPGGTRGALLGAVGGVLVVGLPAPLLAVVALTSAVVWIPWRRARRSGWSPSPRRPATR